MIIDQHRRVLKKDFKENDSADIIRISNQFVDNFLFQDSLAVDIPINALRIIFNIISILRNEQFMPEKQPVQLSLFDEEFETENNVFATIKIRNSKISKNRSSKQIIEAYEYLAKFKMGWYTSKNIAGKDIKTFGGLISLPSYEERGYTSFLISSFWLKKLIVLSEYNHIYYDLVYRVRNNKHILFALWLSKIPDTGTMVKLSTFNQKFRINYKNSNDFCTKFLRAVRRDLDLYNSLSFNYKYENDLIYIIPYQSNPLSKAPEQKEQIDLKSVRERIRYFKKRYSLEQVNLSNFIYNYVNIDKTRNQIENAYSDFIKSNRAKGTISNKAKGVYFLQELQAIMIENYRKTEIGKRLPNGYPLIL